MRQYTRPLVLAAFMMLATLTGTTSAAPEPSIVQNAWQFDLTFGKPQPVSIVDVDGSTRWFWYLPYKVINRTGEDRLFIPDVTLSTDAGDIFIANRDVPTRVFRAIATRQGNPLLLSPVDVIGRLLQGEDYAKESVIIWPAFHHTVHEVRIFISGLSGETLRFNFGRNLLVEDGTGKKLFDIIQRSEQDLQPLPGPVRQRLTSIDLSTEGLRRMAEQQAADDVAPTGTQTITLEDNESHWKISHRDSDYRITITQAKAGGEFVLRKTLMLTYSLPGRDVHPQQQAVVFEGEEWIMR